MRTLARIQADELSGRATRDGNRGTENHQEMESKRIRGVGTGSDNLDWSTMGGGSARRTKDDAINQINLPEIGVVDASRPRIAGGIALGVVFLLLHCIRVQERLFDLFSVFLPSFLLPFCFPPFLLIVFFFRRFLRGVDHWSTGGLVIEWAMAHGPWLNSSFLTWRRSPVAQ